VPPTQEQAFSTGILRAAVQQNVCSLFHIFSWNSCSPLLEKRRNHLDGWNIGFILRWLFIVICSHLHDPVMISSHFSKHEMFFPFSRTNVFYICRCLVLFSSIIFVDVTPLESTSVSNSTWQKDDSLPTRPDVDVSIRDTFHHLYTIFYCFSFLFVCVYVRMYAWEPRVSWPRVWPTKCKDTCLHSLRSRIPIDIEHFFV